MLHCLLTVLFLLDFIKTPSAVSSGMVEEVVVVEEEEEMEEEGNERKARDLAAAWKENGWTHVESAGCHGGLLSEGHRHYMRPRELNEIFKQKGLVMGTSSVSFRRQRFWFLEQIMQSFKFEEVHERLK